MLYMLFTRLLLSLVLPAALAAPSDPVVETASGKVRGVLSPGGVQVYRGIPYAEPPTGPRRWQAPVPHAPWSNVYAATQDGAGCPQQCRLPAITCPPVQSEDCLFLNVFVPPSVSPNAGGAAKAVMFWIHGGDFYQGMVGSFTMAPSWPKNKTWSLLPLIPARSARISIHRARQGHAVYGKLRSARPAAGDAVGARKYRNFGGDPEMVTILANQLEALSCFPLEHALLQRTVFPGNPPEQPRWAAVPHRRQSSGFCGIRS